MKIFRWERGRQKTHYSKLPLVILGYENHNRLPIIGFLDCLLLKFPPGSFIGKHKDSVEVENPDGSIDRYAHYRLNIVLKKSRKGGQFICESNHSNWSLFNRIFFFRSDICTHRVTKVMEGTRYVLTIGWGNFTKPFDSYTPMVKLYNKSTDS